MPTSSAALPADAPRPPRRRNHTRAHVTAWCWLAGLPFVAHCARSSTATPPSPPAPRAPDTAAAPARVFGAPGAPDPYACASTAECTSGAFPDDTGCRIAGTAVAHTQVFHAWWTATWVAAHCAGGRLPTVNPSQPRPCELALRCAAGRCGNTCP